MNTDRFKNFDPDVRRLVLAFERGGEGVWMDVDELTVVADYYLEVRDVEGLEAAVSKGERIYPHNGDIRLRRAQLLGIKGAYGQALRILKQLEQEEPDNTDVFYSLGTLYSLTDNPQASIYYYLKAAADGYELGMIYGIVADEYVKLGNTVQAVRYYRKALTYDPNEGHWLYSLSNIWGRQLRYGQAVQFFTQHVSDHPYCKEAWYCLGIAYLWGAQYDTQLAVDAFEYALAIDSQYESACTALSEAYMMMGDIPRAVKTLRSALDFAADRPDILHSIGCLYMADNNYHTAYVYFQDALKEDDTRAYFWDGLGRCSQCLGYVEEAVEQFVHAINLEPEFDCYWLNLADLYISQLRWADAASLLESARGEATDPYDFDVRLLYCYYKMGRRNRLTSLMAEAGAKYGPMLKDLLLQYPDMAQDWEIVSTIEKMTK